MNSSHVVILTGAGISADSGVKTFRDHGGLWENHRIEDVASPQGFKQNPRLVQEFYNLRRQQLFEVEPNQAHFALAKLERNYSGRVTLITQNVDDLHERAGFQNIIHMHGELRKIRHIQTGEVKYFTDSLPKKDFLTWRPHIVWFGENIMESHKIEEALETATLFLSIGTSAQVYPAAGFVDYCLQRMIPTFELNLEKTHKNFSQSITGRAKDIVPRFIDDLLVTNK